jgi:NAD dependent epimerase/dehydratase family enzyme
MSWIHLNDVTRVIRHLLESDLRGPVNVVGPNPVTNAEFTRILGQVLSRPTLFPVPGIVLEAVFAEMAAETLLGSQRALPRKLGEAGFVWSEPELSGAIIRALG